MLAGHVHVTDFNVAFMYKDESNKKPRAIAGTRPYMGKNGAVCMSLADAPGRFFRLSPDFGFFLVSRSPTNLLSLHVLKGVRDSKLAGTVLLDVCHLLISFIGTYESVYG